MSDALSLSFSPLLPWPWLLILGALSLGVTALCLLRQVRGSMPRTLFALLLLIALANPSLIAEQREGLPNVVLMILDETPSQQVAPRPDQLQEAEAYLQAQFDTLPNLEVRTLRLESDLGQDNDGTRLAPALRRALGEVPQGQLAGVFLVSDGRIHDVDAVQGLLGEEAPLQVLLTGQRGEGDRRITITQAPAYSLVDQEQKITLRVDDLSGDEAGQTAAMPPGGQALVHLRQAGMPPRSFLVPLGKESDVSFTLDRRGRSILEIEVDPGPDELSLINNRAAVEVQGVRERLRVLLVSGEPHAGERAWRNLLKSDPSIDLVHFTILRPPEKQDGTPIRELSLIAFPTRELFEVKLKEFDLIIFDRYQRRGVLPQLYLANVAQYVEEGGALLEAVGPAFATPLSLYRTPLGAVLPGEPSGRILQQRFTPRLTATGLRHPVTTGLPGVASAQEVPTWGDWLRQIDLDSRRGEVVMSGIEQKPLLILDRVGSGRVAQLASDHIWLWARGYDGGGPQRELTRRIAHWLMKEPELEEEDLRAKIEGATLSIERRSLTVAARRIQVVAPDGTETSLVIEPDEKGAMQVELPVSQPGLYRVNDGALQVLATAGPLNPLEYRDLRRDQRTLAPLIAATGGRETTLDQAEWPNVRMVSPGRDRSGRDWLGIVDRAAFRVTGIDRTPLLPGLLLLLLSISALAWAWQREGR